MGSTNLRKSLETKMGHWAAELDEKKERIIEIESLFEQLPVMTERTQRLSHVLECANEVMAEIDPTWRPSRVKPVKAFVHKGRVRLGQVAKLALDILRESDKPLTAREISEEVLQRDGVEDASKEEVQRIVNSVDASLRAKLGDVVVNDGGYPRRWSICRQISNG